MPERRPPSRRHPVRWIALALVAAVAVSGCGAGGSGEGASGKDGAGSSAAGWSFPDGHGGTVELEAPPKVIAAQSVVAGSLWELGIVADGVFGPLRRASGEPDPAVGLADPDEFDSLGEVDSEINVEKLAALRPELIVTAMWGDDMYWGIDDAEVGQLEQIAPIVGIRVDDRPVTEPLAQIGKLAASLGAPAGRLAKARAEFRKASDRLEAALEAKPGLRVVAASGTQNEMYVAWPPGWPDLSYFHSLGMDLAEPKDHPTSNGFWETLSWEESDKYPADLILADSRGGTLQEILDFLPGSVHELPAVKANQITLWDAAGAYGYRNFARIIDRLTGAVEQARAGVDS
jgi:iron complex transport system substrate-binding protein